MMKVSNKGLTAAPRETYGSIKRGAAVHYKHAYYPAGYQSVFQLNT